MDTIGASSKASGRPSAATARGRLAGSFRPAPGIRWIRLCSGMVLFGYVALHLCDHALLNISIDTAEAMLRGMKTVWQSLPGAIVLYSAMTAHLALAYWALYERRHFQWRASEAVQLVLGFCIPVLLANHILATRISLTLYGTQKGYPIELDSFWVANIPMGIMQHVVLVVAWVHGCLGMYFWFRLRPWFQKVAPTLLGLAVLLPALALLGSYQGGRVIQHLATDPAWRAQYLTPGQVGLPAQNALLVRTRSLVWIAFSTSVALVLAARATRSLVERQRGLVRISYADGRTVSVPRGLSVLEASRLYRVPHQGLCGGRGRCTTCRVRVFNRPDELPPAAAGEASALRRQGAAADVRLGCQLRPLVDVRLALMVPALKGPRQRPMRGGEERYLVVMFVDLRGSTRLSEHRLPFDTVFVLNSFLAAVGRAVAAAGGQANQMLGDGLLGLFGLECDGVTAARQAMMAAAGIARNVALLNEQLAADLPEPLRFGIGVNGGEVIVGDVGYDDTLVFTALGDPVNVASRLETMTKEHGCELLVVEAVYLAAGLEALQWPQHLLQLRGRAVPLVVRGAGPSEWQALAPTILRQPGLRRA